MVEEKALHPEWSGNQVGEAVRQKLKQSHIFKDSEGGLILGLEPASVFFITTLLLKAGWFGWKCYKGNTELPDEVEEWIEVVVEAL